MNIFDLLIVQPIFNILLFIYGIIPGNDFGIALIIFTILVRLVMWPLIKKQLHQTKLMRKIQPELKKIKAKTKGNKALEAQLMMEMYREKGIKPFSSIGLLLLQLPIFIALFRVIQIITVERDQIGRYTYEFMSNIPAIGTLLDNPQAFNEYLFGIIDLTQTAFNDNGIYIPLLLMALLAAGLQFVQSRQLLPQQKSKKRLRDIMKDSAKGKDVDQSEVTAIMSGRMIMFLPLVLFFVALYLPGALVLYYAMTSLVAVIQQHFVLSKDVEEMEDIADAPAKKSQKTSKKKTKEVEGKKSEAKARAEKAQEATVVAEPAEKRASGKKKSGGKQRKKRG